ncbi:signal transduction histidine kinase [Lipingzhangella halophila]|uniref:Signal transduction histidine kinase n=1 Tax=Lipingzhangella halophila TaxID=1783352 RepID=A0A7W7REF0_9ACTN|nr:histidine kinase [Lipingzhangella halophila]MBB4930143.1 signal transduction histidine kinase [Lipingzhangella halophila]
MASRPVESDTGTATLPRLTALARLLLQLRLALAALALLLIPAERLTPATISAILAFTLLSGMVAFYWERFVPYLLVHPLLVALDVVVASGILAIDGPSGALFLTTVLTGTISGVLFGGWGVAAVATLQIFCYFAAILTYMTTNTTPPVEITNFQVLVVHPLLYPIAGYVGRRVRSILTELAAEQQIRQQAERAAAAAEERNRLARDIHDSVAKTLRGASMAAQSLPVWVSKDPERAAATAIQVAAAAETAAAEARALLTDLRDGASAKRFGDVVSEIVSDWSEETGIDVHVDTPRAEVSLLVTPRHEALAILKEALANVERHSAAGSVWVTVESGTDHCTVTVRDDGVGFSAPPDTVFEAERNGSGHFGLLGMAERAERAGGSLDVDSTSGQGTLLRLTVPMAAPISPAGQEAVS